MPRERTDLLLEIGTEEIPAGVLTGALPELEKRARKIFVDARIAFERVETLGTPRRLTVIVSGVASRQAELSEEVVGPPARVAFAEDGTPTKAAVGFAKKNGVAVDELRREEVQGRKGEYVVCTRRDEGRATAEVLPARLEALIAEMPWPKSMRWSAGDVAFVRPVQWLVCLLGTDVLPIAFASIEAGAESRGHRFLAPEPFRVQASRVDYESALRDKLVVVNPAARRTMIAAEITRLERESGARVRPDPELEAEVANLVEYPVGLVGEFDARFLAVPEAVIVSAMRGHQRYFAMEDEQGVLVNKFAAIAGTITRDPSVVVAGNQRVLAARLADATFFFDEDCKASLGDLAAKLDGVVFQRKLGSIGAKVGRVVALVDLLAERAGLSPENRAHATRAAALCKADLVSSVVQEFPDLQGTMGRAYAARAGEPDEVATAIEEHYLPRGAGDSLPTTDAGALVGIADRIDTLIGCFAAGLAPTGSADPYGLRRAAVAILSVLLDRSWSIPLVDVISAGAAQLEGVLEVTDEQRADIAEFFRVRLKGLLSELPSDCVEAALAAGANDIPDARARADAVAKLRGRSDFEPLATAFKRVANILKGVPAASAPDPDSFVEDDERALWTSFSEIRTRAEGHLDGGDYHGALSVLAELKAPVDRFFDAVLVMDKDEGVRQNRLALLGQINATFTRIADFRQLAV